MRIISLKLENFQGIKSAAFDFDGQNADIFGQNASGKTTIKNAHCWLLFGRSGDGVKNYTPKTNDIEGGYVHNLDHAAEETLQLDDGRILTLRRVYREVYKKKRGSAQEAFDGNTVEYFINGVPTAEKEYDAAVTKLSGGDIERLKVLTIPEYFPSELGWQTRRQILLSLCGDITDEDVINSSLDLMQLPQYLKIPGTEELYTIEEYRRIATAKKADINNKLKTIPARIDEAERATPNTSAYTRDSVQADLTRYRTEKEKVERERAESKASGSVAQDARTARQSADSALREAKNKYLENVNEQNENWQNERRNLVKTAQTIDGEIITRTTFMHEQQGKMKRTEELRKQLLAEYETISAIAWNPEKSVCPTCNRTLPEEDIAKLRDEFNLNKSKKLESIRNRGKKEASADMIAELANGISNAQTIIESLSVKRKGIEELIAEAESHCIKADFESTDEYKDLYEKVELFRSAELSARDENTDSDALFGAQIAGLSDKIRECETKLLNLEIRKKQIERMAELQAEEKNLSSEYETLDAGTFLCEAFIRQKVRMLTDSINGRFTNVRFRLFVDQINGGLKEDCEVMIPSPSGNLVPYSTANGGAKIIAGIEIIKVLSEHWGLNVPLIVDNAESITSDFDTDGQMIRLTANKRDTVLRVELYDDSAEPEISLTAS